MGKHLLGFAVTVLLITAGNRSARTVEEPLWSFQSPRRPSVPSVSEPSWVRTPVDAFILRKLDENGLRPAQAADKRTLLRRIFYDLTGLPPTPEDVDRFVQDPSPKAYESVVEKLLNSPHYGERWGRHWLDVVRYADTGGYQTDLYYEDAWRYRDYVISSLNNDKPYNVFVQEQIAGDELWPDNLDLQGSYYLDPKKHRHVEARLGTGLYTISPIYHESGLDVERYHDMQWTDWVDITGEAFMGLTLGCARCHDHKFDPISQNDYFGLRAIFAGSERKKISLAHRMDIFDQWQSFPKHIRMQQLRGAAERVSERAKKGELTPEEKKKYDELLKKIGKTYLDTLKPEPTATVLGHSEIIPEVHLLLRGDYASKGEVVAPAFPEALRRSGEVVEDSAARGSPRRFIPERRKALALWLTKPDHPLTARVMVNRLWQGHFGRGIVPTPNDFGHQGQPPTHPDLLDWLAIEFVEKGWSVKNMHRLMVLSTAYRMSSRFDRASADVDPQNRLFWRMNGRRLDAEEIWDTVLAAAGTLTLKTDPTKFLRRSKQKQIGLLNPMGGPPAFPLLSADERDGGDLLNKAQWPASLDPSQLTRRGVYVYVKRSFHFPMFQTFDSPDGNLSCSRRNNTTVAPQSLALMNSQFTHIQAKAFAARLTEGDGDPAAWAANAWRIALARSPTDEEKQRNVEFLRSLKTDEKEALTKLCLAIFNLNEFIFID